MTRHACNPRGDWPICAACRGRIHRADCTTPRLKVIDCCPARHKAYFELGQTRGLDDDAIDMFPEGKYKFITLAQWGK